MANLGHTDYYQFSWETIVNPSSGHKPQTGRLLVLALIFLLLASLLLVAWFVLDLTPQEFFWLAVCSAIIYGVIVVIFWYQLGIAHEKPRIVSYKINEEGIWVENEHVTYPKLNLPKIKALVEAVEFNREPMLVLKLPRVGRNTLDLHFQDEATYKRFLAALRHYVTST